MGMKEKERPLSRILSRLTDMQAMKPAIINRTRLNERDQTSVYLQQTLITQHLTIHLLAKMH